MIYFTFTPYIIERFTTVLYGTAIELEHKIPPSECWASYRDALQCTPMLDVQKNAPPSQVMHSKNRYRIIIGQDSFVSSLILSSSRQPVQASQLPWLP